MKGWFVTGLLLLSFTLIACSSSQTKEAAAAIDIGLNYVPSAPDRENDIPVQPVSGKTAIEYFNDEKIFAGFNIGNSLDAHAHGEASETSWGNPRINQELMDGIKAAGFDIVRIPVTWIGHFGSAPDYRLNERYLRRVAQVVTMANNAGLKAIINLHHDGAGGVPDAWLSINTARRSSDGYQKVTFQFVRTWTQIASYFKNYGDWLMFESCNEIHDGYWGNSSFDILLPQFKILNEWNQFFTEAVRKTGGNNTARYLIIPGYVTNARHTLGNNFKLPEDSVPGRLIVTFHYYDPQQLGLQGTQSRWGSDSDKQKVDSDFAPFKAKFVDNNIPVIIGECGAVLQLYPDDPEREEIAHKSRVAYLAQIYGTAKKYGLVPFYWDNGGTTGSGEKFGIFNRRDGTPNSPRSDEVIKAMIDAARQ